MKLYYREKGDPQLPPLIILHGLWGSSDNWLPMAGLLSDRFHVILPDLRNHGLSPHHPQHDYNALSEDIATFIGQLNLPIRPFFAGHSMGGKALMVLLLKQPEIAAKAAIIDICPKAYEGTHMQIHRRLLTFISSVDPTGYLRREEICTLIRQAFPEEEFYQLLLKNICKTDTGYEWKINEKALRNNLEALADWPQQSTEVSYRSEILFIKGESSDYILPTDIPQIHRFFPLATIKILPGATHLIHADQPLLLAEILTNTFLAPPLK